MSSHLELVMQEARELARSKDLLGEEVTITVRALRPEEAIGRPHRDDFPILKGREVMIEARLQGWRGHAFTDEPMAFRGSLGDVLELHLDTNGHRALAVSVANALVGFAGLQENTVHCKDDRPKRCGEALADTLRERFGPETRVGLVGLNPALLEALVGTFGAADVAVSDLDPDNVGQVRMGVEVAYGTDAWLVERSDVLLVTGTTLINGTFDTMARLARTSGTHLMLYGVTAASLAAFTGMERWCPLSFSGAT